MKRKTALIFFMCLSVAMPSVAAKHGQSPYTHKDPGTKLFRGLGNIVESVTEYGCVSDKTTPLDSPGQRVADVFIGIGYTLRRALVGIFQVMTFFLPGEIEVKTACSRYSGI